MEACDHAAMADNSDNSDADHDCAADTSASKGSIRRFVITEKAPTRAFSWLKADTIYIYTFKTVVATFNQEKALAGAFSVITNLRMELFESLM